MGLTIRPYNSGDLDYLRIIDIQGSENPWTDVEINRHGDGIMVAVEDFRPRAFVATRILNQRVMLLRLVVDPDFRRQGLGSRLMKFVLFEYGFYRRITTLVAESNLPAQCFLRSHGWRCVNVMKRHFDICGQAEDGFYFVRKLNNADDATG